MNYHRKSLATSYIPPWLYIKSRHLKDHKANWRATQLPHKNKSQLSSLDTRLVQHRAQMTTNAKIQSRTRYFS